MYYAVVCDYQTFTLPGSNPKVCDYQKTYDYEKNKVKTCDNRYNIVSGSRISTKNV